MNEPNANYDSDQSLQSGAATRDGQGDPGTDRDPKSGLAVTRDGQGDPGTDRDPKPGLAVTRDGQGPPGTDRDPKTGLSAAVPKR